MSAESLVKWLVASKMKYMYIQIENVLENNYLEVFTNTYSCACMKGFVHFVQQIYVYKSI